MYRRGLLFLFLLLILGVVGSWAQDPDYQKWVKKEQEKLQQFKDERDKEFTEFLKREWKEMKASQGLVRDEVPEPEKMPTFKEEKVSQPEPESHTVHLQSPPEEKNSIGVAPEPRAKTETERGSGYVKLEALFFDSRVEFQTAQTALPHLDQINKEGISDFWAAISRTNYELILDEAAKSKTTMKLNDWGYVLLLHSFGEKLFKGSNNEATLFTWFLLLKSGYDAKVGYNNDRVFLLLPTANTLYHVPYFPFKDKDSEKFYYAVSLKAGEGQLEGSLLAYEGKYPQAERLIDFAVPVVPVIGNTSESKMLRFDYAGKMYSLPISYSKDAVRFFLWYPQTDFEVYFSALPSTQATKSLFDEFRGILQGKTELEAVNILLRFCQTAFRYESDQKQFGREKPFFPDEVLYYDASNCKDRAVLFAYMVRSLLGIEVVGLDYPGHVSTAVIFSTNIPGDSVVVHGKKFIICDPTYTNANVGTCMPQFKTVNPKIILIASQRTN